MGRLGAEQEIGVEIDGCLEPARRVQADGDGGGRGPVEVGLHAQGAGHVGVGCHEHAAERHGLQRLLGLLAQHRRSPQTDLLADRGAVGGAGGVAIGTDHVVQGGRQV